MRFHSGNGWSVFSDLSDLEDDPPTTDPVPAAPDVTDPTGISPEDDPIAQVRAKLASALLAPKA